MKRILSGFTIMAFILTGCGAPQNDKSASEEKSLTYWVEFGNQASTGVVSFDELPPYIRLQEVTGVDLQFIHPVVGQVHEQFNLMIASNEYPDIIQYQISEKYPGGAQKAIDDECILPLNDIFENYAPNIKKYLDQNPDIRKQVSTDTGQYFSFPCLFGDEYLLTYTGLIMRKDFLDKVNLERPETIDEWYTVLTAFKEQLNLPSPLTIMMSNLEMFSQAYGVGQDIYVDEGKVKYGPVEPNYRKAIELMRKWYAEGLLDKNLPTLDTKVFAQNVLNSYTGAVTGNTGGGIGTWTAAMKDDPEFELTPVKYPVLNKGDKPFIGHRINEYLPFGSASISTQCKNVELAAKVLDYGYGEAGQLLFNFGIEGESYNMIDGYPTYTELVTNNPNGKSFVEMRGYYSTPNGAMPTIFDKRYMEQSAALPQQKESIELWGDSDAKHHNIPPISFTAAESTEVASLITDISTYRDQMMMKFITGVEDMSQFDAFVAQLNKLGVPRYLEIYQNAYDRYMKK